MITEFNIDLGKWYRMIYTCTEQFYIVTNQTRIIQENSPIQPHAITALRLWTTYSTTHTPRSGKVYRPRVTILPTRPRKDQVFTKSRLTTHTKMEIIVSGVWKVRGKICHVGVHTYSEALNCWVGWMTGRIRFITLAQEGEGFVRFVDIAN